MLQKFCEVAEDGNVSAMRTWLILFDRGNTAPRAPAAPKPPRLGKKEQLAADAANGHQASDWGNLLH